MRVTSSTPRTNFFRRRLVDAAMAVVFPAASVMTATLSAFTPAQSNYLSKPIRLVVPFTPGGVTDTNGRLIADHYSISISIGQVVAPPSGAVFVGALLRLKWKRNDKLPVAVEAVLFERLAC